MGALPPVGLNPCTPPIKMTGSQTECWNVEGLNAVEARLPALQAQTRPGEGFEQLNIRHSCQALLMDSESSEDRERTPRNWISQHFNLDASGKCPLLARRRKESCRIEFRGNRNLITLKGKCFAWSLGVEIGCGNVCPSPIFPSLIFPSRNSC